MLSSLALLCALLAVFCQSRTINWNHGGGTNEWFNIANWDCQCVPTAADDVVINLSVPTTVLIGGQNFPALAKTLTVGGSSSASQVLIITGALTVVSGGVLNTNGRILVESGQNAPFTNNGTFTVKATAGFVFATGTLAGNGAFVFPPNTLLNFSNPAAKTIATHVQVDGTAQTSSATGSTIIIARNGGLVINGLFKSQTSLTITVDPLGTFGVVKGTFVFTGPTLNLQGSSSIFQWVVGSGSSVNLDHPITSANLALSGTIRMTGAPAIGRSFTNVNGTGSIVCEGGSNTFISVQADSLFANGGVVTITSSSVTSFTLNGGEVRGSKLSSSYSALKSGTLSQGLVLTVSSSLLLEGIVNLNGDGTSIVTGRNSRALVSDNSQLTLTDNTLFSSSSTLSQTGTFKLVGTNSSKVVNTASWAVNGSLNVFNLYTQGGNWHINSQGSIQFTSANFAVNEVTNDGTVSFTSSTFSGSVAGKGNWEGFPTHFYSPQYTSSGRFSINNGVARIDNGSVGTLLVEGGQFLVSSKLSVGNLLFSVGTISGNSLQQSSISAQAFSVTGSVVTLKNIKVYATKLQLSCGTNCQLLTDHAAIATQ